MKLIVVGSGSSGNCYFLSCENEMLMIECGVAKAKTLEEIDFDTSKVVGCLVSHEHGDHAKEANTILKAGIPLYASKGTIDGIKVKSKELRSLARPVAHGEVFNAGGFVVMPFDVDHDANEPLGFLIDHIEFGRLLFITDTAQVNFKFNNVSHMMIEANYMEEILQRNVEYGLEKVVAKRIRESHFEVNKAIRSIQENDSSSLRNVVLIHLSNGNSDAKLFKKMVEEETFCNVFVAENGSKIDLI